MNTILIKLIFAHVLTDFVFQSDKWVEQKNSKGLRSVYFWMHIFLAGATTYVVLQLWTNWYIPAMIMATHGILDFWKIKKERRIGHKSDVNATEVRTIEKQRPNRIYSFLLDQALHLIVIIIAWLIITENFNRLGVMITEMLADRQFLIITTTVVILIWPAGIVIDIITEPLRRELGSDDSLTKAGFYIGILERILVFLFVVTGEYGAIGFLIASKSILRITRDGDLNNRKKTEYVLIGTLLSFTIALVAGLIVRV